MFCHAGLERLFKIAIWMSPSEKVTEGGRKENIQMQMNAMMSMNLWICVVAFIFWLSFQYYL